MRNIFEIECKDIVLREFGIDDLDALYNLTLQPEITDFLPDWIATKEQRRDWLINDHIKNNRDFFQVVPDIHEEGLILGIILKETNEFIGWCGSYIKEELPPPNREIFYAISKDYRGRGYTTQASQGLIKYLFEKTNIEELNAIALLHNIPSNKVIQKSGFNHIGTIEVDNEEFNHYKLVKKNFTIEEATSEDEKFIANKIKEYSPKKASVERIHKTMKDLDGNIIGGILSIVNHYAKSLYIDILWIKEEYRKDGYGSILMDEVEMEAKEKGVYLVNLDTFDFQAKDFYIKRGYEVYAVLDDCPVNHKRYYLRKML